MYTYEIIHDLQGGREHKTWRDRVKKGVTALALVLVFLAGAIVGHFGYRSKHLKTPQETLIKEEDTKCSAAPSSFLILFLAPSESSHPVKFMPNTLYNPAVRTTESDMAWNTYPTGGYVLLQTAHDAGSTSWRKDLGGYIYAVSGYHQIHCISIIRNAWVLVLDKGPQALANITSFPHHPSGAPVEPHVNHCFDYLRQTALCHADATLEPFLEEDGFTIKKGGSSGWGVVHQCRDWAALARWVDQHDAIRQGWGAGVAV